MTKVANADGQTPGQESFDNEISVVEIAIILVRRKWWALGIFAFVLAAALAYTVLLAPREYTGSAELELMHVPQALQAQPPPDIAETLKNEFTQDDPGLSSVELSEGILSLEFQGKDRNEVQSQLADATSMAQELAEKKFMPWARTSLNDYQERITAYKQRIQLLEKKILQEKDSESLAALIKAEVALDERLDKKYEQLEEMEKAVGQSFYGGIENDIQPVEVIKEPTVSIKGVSVKLVLALSVVLGSMAGIFAAFFAEFIANVRRRMQEEQHAEESQEQNRS